MNKQKATEMYQVIENWRPMRAPIKFSHGLNRNKSILDPEMKAINKAGAALSEYTEKRIELCEKHSEKDKKKKAILDKDNKYAIIDKASFNKDFAALRKEYEKELKEWEEFMQSECDLEFYTVDFQHFPTEISGIELELLAPMIKESNGAVR